MSLGALLCALFGFPGPSPVNLIPPDPFRCNSPCLWGKSFGSTSAPSFLGFLKSPGGIRKKGREGVGLNSKLELEVKNWDEEDGSVQNYTVIEITFWWLMN